MSMNVTFVIASRKNIKDLLELCNHSLFLNGSGTRSKWTSSLVWSRCHLCRHRPILQGCPFSACQGDDLCLLVGILVCFQNRVPPWHSVGDQFIPLHPFHLKTLG